MEKKTTAFIWLGICLACNFADAVLTFFALSKGVEEANPIMAWAFSISPSFFVVMKFILFSVAIEFIACFKPSLLKWIGTLFMAVVAWHLSFVFFI